MDFWAHARAMAFWPRARAQAFRAQAKAKAFGPGPFGPYLIFVNPGGCILGFMLALSPYRHIFKEHGPTHGFEKTEHIWLLRFETRYLFSNGHLENDGGMGGQ